MGKQQKGYVKYVLCARKRCKNFVPEIVESSSIGVKKWYYGSMKWTYEWETRSEFMDRIGIFIVYLVIINIIGIIVMGADKQKAKTHTWRIPEKSLFLVSILGGSIGTWAGMYLFRHKTKHWYFVIGMPLILVIQIGVSVYGFMELFGGAR